jgi:hypothetical protein
VTFPPLENHSDAHAEKALAWLRYLSGERPDRVPSGNGLDADETRAVLERVRHLARRARRGMPEPGAESPPRSEQRAPARGAALETLRMLGGEGLPGDRLHPEHVDRISWLLAHSERRTAPPGPAAEGAAGRRR